MTADEEELNLQAATLRRQFAGVAWQVETFSEPPLPDFLALTGRLTIGDRTARCRILNGIYGTVWTAWRGSRNFPKKHHSFGYRDAGESAVREMERLIS